MDVEIRQVGPGDAAIFDRVADGVFDEPINPDRLAAYLAEPGHYLVVAMHRDAVVGQVAAVVHKHPDKAAELYLDDVGVAPEFHRRGIARRMVEAMMAIGRELGCEEVWVGTEHDNVPARRLYESFGMEGKDFVLYLSAL